jgi:AcrR family transcriptional regulator
MREAREKQPVRREPAGREPDGRELRGARSHAAIAEAMYELVRTTHAAPTMEEVARRAGVGTRTVFRQFQDMDSLYRTLNERLLSEVVSLVAVVPPSGELEADLRALVSRRAQVFEHMTPFRRASRAMRHASAFLRGQDARLTQLLRAMLAAVVAPHLGTDAETTLEALDALTSFEVWDRLRDAQRLSPKLAERVVADAAVVLASAAAAATRRPPARSKAR